MTRIDGRLVVAPAIAVGLSLSGCSAVADALSSAPALERCYDQPRPIQEIPTFDLEYPGYELYAGDPYDFEGFDKHMAEHEARVAEYERQRAAYDAVFHPPIMEVPIGESGLADGDPITMDYTAEAAVESAIVQIDVGDATGSGFAMTNSTGEQVIITAAHVVNETPYDEIKVTDNKDESSTVSAGCIMYEDEGKFLDPASEENSVDIDIAVLKLKENIGLTALKASGAIPARGEWVHFMNYQAYSKPGYPARYTGLVTQSNLYEELDVLTGVRELDVPITNGEFDRTHLVSGGSGGPVIKVEGEVPLIVGVSVTSTKDGLYDGPEDLEILDSIAFPGADYGDEGGFVPTRGGAMPLPVIQQALAATPTQPKN